MKKFTNAGQFKKGDPKLKIKTPAHRKAISEGQRRAWLTKRQRMPIGSKWVDHQSYVHVKVLPGKGAWPREHVLAMERIIGRKLHSGEIVHHIDGDRQNNSDDNLYLCRDNRHHQAVERQLKETFRAMLKAGKVTFCGLTGEYACH